MLTNAVAEAIDEENDDNNELLHELQENNQDSEFTRLTEMVRQHYLNYLEKQLQENLLNSNFNNSNKVLYRQDFDDDDGEEVWCKKSIRKTAELLEDKAVKACMIAKFYQRAMVKIIAIVRRTTQEKRLFTHLEKCIKTKDKSKTITTNSKETQTEAGLLEEVFPVNDERRLTQNERTFQSNDLNNDENKMSLDEKIEMFQKHLQKEKCLDIVKKYPLNNHHSHKMSKRQQQQHHHHNYRRHNRHRSEHHSKPKQEEIYFSPTSSIVTAPTSPISPVVQKTPLHTSLHEPQEPVSLEMENENSNDSVALELARLFSEEKTELDEIFGIDPNEEPDDPQICKILKEIEDAKINQTKTKTDQILNTSENPEPPEHQQDNFLEPKQIPTPACQNLFKSIDLSKSIWPCELFMQRRKLSESLARLIEEDLRWHDVMKWKFAQLFGEDSDDEFTPCSPSIELNDVLIGSCIRRISPWVVDHLMKPMRDGLIGNRFLFKKLAKSLARSIIMENQYPDESIIKDCVETFFCLHQAVMSLEDLDVATSF